MSRGKEDGRQLNSKTLPCKLLCRGTDPSLSSPRLRTDLPSFNSRKKRKKVKSLSRVQLFSTPWTVAYQGPLSMGLSRPEYWSGLSFPSPGDLPNPGTKPRSPTLWADALRSEPPGKQDLAMGSFNSKEEKIHSSLENCLRPVL